MIRLIKMMSPAILFTLFPLLLTAQTNPITYNAITNGNTYSSSAPKLGVAGTTTIDPDFGTTVLRVTQSGSCAATAGYDFTTPDAGWSPMFNSNETEIMVNGDETGSRWFIMSFNESTLAVGANCTKVVGGILGTNSTPRFSKANPNIIWGTDPSSSTFVDTYNFSTATTTKVKNMSTIPGFAMNNMVLFDVDSSDQWICASNDGQDAGTQLGCYNKSTGNTQVLNLGAGTEQQNSGNPVALNNLTKAQLAGCGIHEIYDLKDGTWALVGLNGCTDFPSGSTTSCCVVYWQLGTNNVSWQVVNSLTGEGTLQGGHRAMGIAGGLIISTPTPDPPCNYYSDWAYWNASSSGVAPNPHYVSLGYCSLAITYSDDHLSWLNNYNDSYANQYPVFVWSNEDTTNTGAPYEWEIFAVQTSAAHTRFNAGRYGTSSPPISTIWRFAHSYNDPIANQCNLNDTSPIVSPDGQFVMFTSDWLGGTGTGTCTNNRRTDVFIVRLPLNSSTAPATAKPLPPSNLSVVVN